MVVSEFPDDSPNEQQQRLSHKERPGNVQGMVAHHNFYRPTGTFHGYQSEGFTQIPPVRMVVPCINAQGDEVTPCSLSTLYLNDVDNKADVII